MSKVANELQGRAELAMMGKFVHCLSDEEVNFMTDYIIEALGYGDKLNFEDNFVNTRIRQYESGKKNLVTHMGCVTIYGMPVITYCVDTPDSPKPFTEDYGSGYPASFTYNLNLSDDMMCSEFGDAFFEKKPDGFYHRVS